MFFIERERRKRGSFGSNNRSRDPTTDPEFLIQQQIMESNTRYLNVESNNGFRDPTTDPDFFDPTTDPLLLESNYRFKDPTTDPKFFDPTADLGIQQQIPLNKYLNV